MAVLSILVFIIAELLSGATKTVGLSENQIAVEGEVRTVFATMGNDLANLLKRSDAECIMTKQTGNDYMFFYSETAGYFNSSINSSAQSPLTVVGYHINSNDQLERFAKGLTWDDASGNGLTTGPVFLSYVASANPLISVSYPPAPASSPSNSTTPYDPNSTMESKWPSEIPPPATTSGDSNYEVIGPDIFRMEISFLVSGRTAAGTLISGALSDWPFVSDPTHTNGLQDVDAVVVTLAVLDSVDRTLVTNQSGDLSSLVKAFPDSGLPTSLLAQPTKSSTLPSTAWLTAMNPATTFAKTAGIPLRAASGVRVYQHFFYLNKN